MKRVINSKLNFYGLGDRSFIGSNFYFQKKHLNAKLLNNLKCYLDGDMSKLIVKCSII
jgi:hypothetical protein